MKFSTNDIIIYNNNIIIIQAKIDFSVCCQIRKTKLWKNFLPEKNYLQK